MSKPLALSSLPVTRIAMNANTDSALSLQSEEFLWDSPAATPAHGYLFPTVRDWLRQANARTVLDLGCGLGYSAAVIARIAGTVIAVENDERFAADAQRLLSEEGVDNALVIAGPLAAGAAKHAPYDTITVQGGVETVPDALLAQLKDGGRIGAIFMDGALGTAKIGFKSEGRVSWRPVFNATAPVLDGFRKASAFAL